MYGTVSFLPWIVIVASPLIVHSPVVVHVRDGLLFALDRDSRLLAALARCEEVVGDQGVAVRVDWSEGGKRRVTQRQLESGAAGRRRCSPPTAMEKT